MTGRGTEKDRVSRRIQAELPASGKKSGTAGNASGDAGAGAASAPGESARDAQHVDQALDAIDQAMAQHADELLDGAFESVEEVLSRADVDEPGATIHRSGNDQGDPQGVVDRQAGEAAGDSGESVTTGVPEASAGEAARGEQPDDAADAASPTAVDKPPAPESAMIPSRDAVMKPESAFIPSRDPAVKDDAPAPVEAAEASQAEATGDEPDVEATADAPPEPPAAAVDDGGETENEPDPEPVAEQDASAEPKPAQEEPEHGMNDAPADRGKPAEPKEEKTRSPLMHHVQRLLHLCLAGAASVLNLLSAPLELLPPSLRPLVDWLALSLIFWVPIVWVLVLLMS